VTLEHGAQELTGTGQIRQSQRDTRGHECELLRVVDICARLGVSDETWRRWRLNGLAPTPVRLPGRPRWRVEDIEAFKRGLLGTGRRFFSAR
jgi:predicted DNA-binding transcriptional regulator AlpA